MMRNNIRNIRSIYALGALVTLLAFTPSSYGSEICGSFLNPEAITPRLTGLSGTWAQELIGSDLAREVVQGDPKAKEVPFAVLEEVDLIGIMDQYLHPDLQSIKPHIPCCDTLPPEEQPRGWHGTRAVNLVVHKTYGAAGKAILVDYSKQYGSDAVIESIRRISNKGIKLICNSQGLNLNPKAREVLTEFQNNGGILVSSAGNGFPQDTRVNSYASLYVGNLSPLGLIAGDSDTKDIFIVAPGDLTRTADRREVGTFGGTSAAQPIACGVVANLMAYLPGITSQEVQEIIRRTSISFSQIGLDEKPKVGIINALKATLAAKKIGEQWPENRREIFRESALYTTLTLPLERCRGGIAELANKRATFLLSNENSIGSAKQLTAWYSTHKFPLNALLLENLFKRPEEIITSSLVIDNWSYREAALRDNVKKAASPLDG